MDEPLHGKKLTVHRYSTYQVLSLPMETLRRIVQKIITYSIFEE